LNDRKRGAALLAAFALLPLAHAGTVSATPGTFNGTIVFNAPVQPDSMTIDARDATNTFTANANATQSQAACPAGAGKRHGSVGGGVV
jgi:hypothetical protein